MGKSVAATHHVICGLAQFGVGSVLQPTDTVSAPTHPQGEHLFYLWGSPVYARMSHKSASTVSVKDFGGLMDGLGIEDLDDPVC